MSDINNNKKTEQSQSDWNDEWNLDQFWISQELEFQHQDKELQFRANETNPLKLGKIVNSLFDIRKEEVALLTITNSSASTTVTIKTPDEIWDYNLLSECFKFRNTSFILSLFYRGYEQQKKDKDKSIGKKNGCLIIHLDNASGIIDKVIYVQATFCHPPITLEREKMGMFPQAKTLSILIGYDYRTENEIAEEFNTIWNSLLNKVSTNKADELTLLERQLCDLFLKTKENPPSQLIVQDFYMGKKVMQQNRFWDAIAYFESPFNRLREKWWTNTELSDDEWNILMETSFLIGFCYYELGLFEKAYKYLEMPYKVNDKNYNYFTEYINCLERLKDLRAFLIIENRLKEIIKNEKDLEFVLFCLRRKAYMLIEMEKYEEAKICLKQILNIEPNNEFAKGELGYLSKLEEN
jgi:tetratricopeptide (TPR) repeat protein